MYRDDDALLDVKLAELRDELAHQRRVLAKLESDDDIVEALRLDGAFKRRWEEVRQREAERAQRWPFRLMKLGVRALQVGGLVFLLGLVLMMLIR